LTITLGINAYHADASAAILRDGKIIAAVEEERFTRVKHTAGFPTHAIRYCVAAAAIRPEEIDYVAVPRRRSAHLLRKAAWALRSPALAMGRSRAWRRFGTLKDGVADALAVSPASIRARFHFVEHHVAHVASSYFTSPFHDAAVLSLDGLGDFASMAWGTGDETDLNARGFVLFPHSLGLFYTAVTQYLGFLKYGDEYKVMGLAAYGEPRYRETMERMVAVGTDLDFNLDMRYFAHGRGGQLISWEAGEPVQSRLFSDRLEKELGPARGAGEPVEKRHQDIAATLQLRLEECVFELLNGLHRKTGKRNLAYAGGVAFNCSANGKVFDRTPFREIYIHPAAGDAGLAIGAAAYLQHAVLGIPRSHSLDHAYLGPEYPADQIKLALDAAGLKYVAMEQDQLALETARRIAEGRIVGWYQGRLEWGPRALGNRSIVVDPRRQDMKDILNSRIKHREPFRPFAPSVLEERTAEWFELGYPSPFMLLTYRVREEQRARIPAPTHVDGTARLQTVNKQANPAYWGLIRSFEEVTGVPVVLNTSFNESEPIVNLPEEAINCFARTRMDVLAIGPYLVDR
jgi:carbamoyltransferase